MNKSVEQPQVSIIVPCFARADLTQVCIDSILDYTGWKFELILVQEGEDEEITKVFNNAEYHNNGEECKPIKLAHNKTPKGYSGALNTGLEQATGKYICFMNNDTVAVPGWMDEMLKCFEENEDTGLVCPTFWGSGGKQSIDWNSDIEFDYVDNIFSIIGVCFVIPRTVLDVIGNWDEDYGHGGEDFDIVKRVQDADYSVYVARKSFIYHYGGASTRIVVGNDMAKAKANQLAKLKIFSKKHNVPMEEIMEKINLSNTI